MHTCLRESNNNNYNTQKKIKPNTTMPKKILAITQARGGSGKSTLSFMLAEKYQQAIVIDADDATTATSKQLAYRNPIQVSFLDPTSKRIDRNAFNSLFESVS